MIRYAPLLLAALAAQPALAFDTRARSAYVIDHATGTVLLDKDAEVPEPPASMSKLMTLNMLFEALRDGRVTLDTTFSVSTRAREMGGSSMFLNERDRPTVEELIKGIIVLSGNDACVVVAEGLGGSEDAFAAQMTERGKAIGLEQSTFANASGWPDPRHRMSMKDLALLAERLIGEFPEYYHYFAIEEFPFDNRVPSNKNNRNPILGMVSGADGLKTGHTMESGYGLVGSALQGDRRVTFVLNGLATEKERAEEAESVANWAFRNFIQKTLIKQGQVVETAPVWLGATATVPLTVAKDASFLVPALVQGAISAEVSYVSPLPAPIAAGQEVAMLTITMPDMAPRKIPLVAANDVPEGSVLTRVMTAGQVLIGRALGGVTGGDSEGAS